MGIIRRMRKQTAVYWAPIGLDRQGRPIYDVPVQIKCRWTFAQVMYRDQQGEERSSSAIVFADRDLLLKGYLWQGVVEDAPENPQTNKEVYEIRRFEKIPNFRATEYLLKAYL